MGTDEYYHLISRAVAALEINTFEDRRAVYNRARAVQSYQLGERPSNKKDFDHERSMLEDAIRRVETEATTKQMVAEASASTPVQPSDIAPTPMVPLPSVVLGSKVRFGVFGAIDFVAAIRRASSRVSLIPGLRALLGKTNLTPKDGQEIVSMFDKLDESCPH
jgi:hypothetical protein